MNDRKPDAFNLTGSHRAWVGESAAPAVHANGSARDGARNWLTRPQQPPNSRHAAITKGLSNFPSYKTWTERMKSNWEKDQEK